MPSEEAWQALLSTRARSRGTFGRSKFLEAQARDALIEAGELPTGDVLDGSAYARATPKVGAYVGLGLLAAVAAVLAGRPVLLGLAGPIILAGVVGLLAVRPHTVVTSVEAVPTRVVEGDTVTVTVGLAGVAGTYPEALLDPSPGFVTLDRPAGRAVHLDGKGTGRIDFRVRAVRWGGHPLGSVVVRTRDRLGFFAHELVADANVRVKVHPDAETLRQLTSPRRTQVFAGNRLSRAKGEGVEFADLRLYRAGDQQRQVNWRATARSGRLWVNERHPERNSDVVLLVDTFNALTLPHAVRAAASLVHAYLRQRDRVGVVSFGGVATWVQPTTGLRQVQRLVDALLDSQVFANLVWRDLNVVPPQMLPPQALVVVLSPLEDDRMTAAIEDLRARGIDVAVLEVSPVPFVAPAPSACGNAAFRLWQLQRRARRTRWQRGGIAVVEWDAGRSVAEIIDELEAYRRHSHNGLV